MSGEAGTQDELAELLAELCDGEITPEQAARLEQLASQSAEARRFFLHYVQLHGELCWDQAAEQRAAATSGRMSGRTFLQKHSRLARWAAIAAAVSLLASVGLWSARLIQNRLLGGRAGPTVVARVARSLDAEWADSEPQADPAELQSGQKLALRRGLAEVAVVTGARLIVEGPATFELTSTGHALLRQGKLTARVPLEAAGFAVATPTAKVIDLGTEFGVLVDEEGATEVHVFDGSVQVELAAGPGTVAQRGLGAGQAIRILADRGGGAPQVHEIAAGADRQTFVRAIPQPGKPSVAELRQLAAKHPHLIHHYPFEGAAPREQCRDRRGQLDLSEVVMSGGRGGGALRWSVRGFDATSTAIATFRAARSGNTTGVALQTETEFQPPPRMTVELLLKIGAPKGLAGNAVSCAVATRESGRKCGFLVAAVDDGQLTHLFDSDAPWVEGNDHFAFVPEDWYYVASSFQVEGNRTKVNTYAANLSRGDRELTEIVKDQVAPGVPAVSRLGIGKGLDAALAHAYPWCGELDEVAIYDTVIDRRTLEEHRKAIFREDGP